MVDTAVRLRPGFSTFLHSDTNTGGDGLSFYDYKRLLRANKVRQLQEKRAKSYAPGYKADEPETVQIARKSPQTSNAAAQTNNTQGIAQRYCYFY